MTASGWCRHEQITVTGHPNPRELAGGGRSCAASALAALLLLAAGCKAPEKVAEVERRSIESLRNYHANASGAVEALLGAYRRQARAALRATAEVELARRGTTALPPADAAKLLDTYTGKLDLIDLEVAKFRGAWAGANEDYADAVKLRELVYRWLTRPAVGPEEIDAAGRALSEEIDRAGALRRERAKAKAAERAAAEKGGE